MFYEFREAWRRKRELKDISETEIPQKRPEYKKAVDKLDRAVPTRIYFILNALNINFAKV